MNISLMLAFALTTANVPNTEVPEAPAESPTSERPASATGLIVDVDPTVPRASRIARDLETHGHTALANVKTSLSTKDRIIVRITGEQYAYHIQILTRRSDVVLDETSKPCECSDTDLNEVVSAEVGRAADLLSEAAETSTTDPQPSTTQREGEPSGAEPPPSRVPAPHLSPGALGAIEPADPASPPIRDRMPPRTRLAGVVTLLAGGVLVMVGAGFASAGTTELTDRVPHYERNWRPLGFALGGVGLGAMAAGGSMMIVDEIRCRRRPDACTAGDRYARRRGIENGGDL